MTRSQTGSRQRIVISSNVSWRRRSPIAGELLELFPRLRFIVTNLKTHRVKVTLLQWLELNSLVQMGASLTECSGNHRTRRSTL